MENIIIVKDLSLSIRCENLYTEHESWLRNPLVKVSLSTGNEWTDLGKTEHLKKTNSPQFVEQILVEDYQYVLIDGNRFDEFRKIEFLVYDLPRCMEFALLNEDDYLGKFECVLSEIVINKWMKGELRLHGEGVHGRTKAGDIYIYCEEIVEDALNREVNMEFYCEGIDSKDLFSKSDAFLEIAKVSHDGAFLPVHRTPYLEDTLYPHWDSFSIGLQKLCNGDFDLQLKIKCWDYDKEGDSLIGECVTTLAEMVKKTESSSTCQWDLIKPKKLKKKKYKNSGIVVLKSILINEGNVQIVSAF